MREIGSKWSFTSFWRVFQLFPLFLRIVFLWKIKEKNPLLLFLVNFSTFFSCQSQRKRQSYVNRPEGRKKSAMLEDNSIKSVGGKFSRGFLMKLEAPRSLSPSLSLMDFSGFSPFARNYRKCFEWILIERSEWKLRWKMWRKKCEENEKKVRKFLRNSGKKLKFNIASRGKTGNFVRKSGDGRQCKT